MARDFIGRDYAESPYKSYFEGKNQYTGPEYTWCGMAKLLWGKCEFVLRGERLTCGIPLSFFDDVLDNGGSMGECVEKFKPMTREDIVDAGGFWAYLRAGQGIIIPPGYWIIHVNLGSLEGCEDVDGNLNSVDTFASRLAGCSCCSSTFSD